MQVKKVPDQKLPDQKKKKKNTKNCQIRGKVRLWYEFSHLEVMESLGRVHISSPGKGLLSQIMSPLPHSQISGPLTSWPGDLVQITVCVYD